MEISCGLTGRSEAVFKLAREVADDCNRAEISTVDILFGLVKEGTGIAASMLINTGFDKYVPGIIYREPIDFPDDVYDEWHKCGLRESQNLVGDSKKLLIISAQQAIVCHFHYLTADERNSHNPYLGTEHILLGILQYPACPAFSTLETHLNAIGHSAEKLDREIRDLIGYRFPG